MASDKREPLHLSNAHWYEDRLSVAADFSKLQEVGDAAHYRDRQFGNAWSWTPPTGAAVYGRTSEVPRGLGDEGGPVLRVPFRRVPVIELHSIAEVLALGRGNASNDSSVTGMWRGQSCHYSLKRDPIDQLRLYGDLEADEPSLLPSAARRDLYFPDIFDTWSGLLDVYIEERLERLCETYTSKAAQLLHEARSFRGSYRYRGWGLATAQHYGLPSVGLDLTSDIRVALYFALHRFETDLETGVMSVTPATEKDDPIIYGLGVFKYDLFEDEKLAPGWLNCARPRAQSAFFFGSGWGDSINRAADRVYIAARLCGHTQWASPLSTSDLFPTALDDPFLAFLLSAKDRFSGLAVGELLRQIYFTAA
jgi:hypothetical protein